MFFGDSPNQAFLTAESTICLSKFPNSVFSEVRTPCTPNVSKHNAPGIGRTTHASTHGCEDVCVCVAMIARKRLRRAYTQLR